ncbi:hypothetical protein ACIRBZ_13920 [Streptomyces sp. NPDC094038]|uniref:hypothetical protein n=1 Tax=Streptomyces sp. NPDC094038 TaxID=3366055 RepID=UPI0037F23F82
MTTYDLAALAVLVVTYYAGRARQWWRDRHQRKTAGAVSHIADKFKNKEGQ